MRPAAGEKEAAGEDESLTTEESKMANPTVRSDFPETWIWAFEVTGSVIRLRLISYQSF